MHNRPLFDWRAAFRAHGTRAHDARPVGLALSLYSNMVTCVVVNVTNADLANDLAISERQVRRSLRALEVDGWIERSRTQGGYVYQMTIPTGQAGQSDRTHSPVRPDTQSGPTGQTGRSHRTHSPVAQRPTGQAGRSDRTTSPVPPIMGREAESIACMHADGLGELFAELGLGVVTEDALVELRVAIAGVAPPEGYVEALVRDIARRNPNALSPTVVTMAAQDLERRKWQRDPVWQRVLADKREAEAAVARQQRVETERLRAEADRQANPAGYMSDAELIEHAGEELCNAWRDVGRRICRELPGGLWHGPDSHMYGSLDEYVAEQLRVYELTGPHGEPRPDT